MNYIIPICLFLFPFFLWQRYCNYKYLHFTALGSGTRGLGFSQTKAFLLPNYLDQCNFIVTGEAKLLQAWLRTIYKRHFLLKSTELPPLQPSKPPSSTAPQTNKRPQSFTTPQSNPFPSSSTPPKSHPSLFSSTSPLPLPQSFTTPQSNPFLSSSTPPKSHPSLSSSTLPKPYQLPSPSPMGDIPQPTNSDRYALHDKRDRPYWAIGVAVACVILIVIVVCLVRKKKRMEQTKRPTFVVFKDEKITSQEMQPSQGGQSSPEGQL